MAVRNLKFYFLGTHNDILVNIEPIKFNFECITSLLFKGLIKNLPDWKSSFQKVFFFKKGNLPKNLTSKNVLPLKSWEEEISEGKLH